MSRARLVEPGAAGYRWESWPDDVGGVKQMCRYGAKRFASGECDLVAFDCMKWERETIQAYMEQHFPDVAYVFGDGAAVVRQINALRDPTAGGGNSGSGVTRHSTE